MSRFTIAAVLIAGDSARTDPTDLHRCLKSLEDNVDAVYIAYNGEGELDLPAISTPVFVKTFKWQDDFAAARNQSFSMVPPDSCDWLLWIDTDDTLEGDLQATISELKPNTQGVFLRYDYAVDPATESVLAVQWRERLLRTDANWKWHYPIHEVCHAPIGTQFARKHEAWIRHWRHVGEDHGATRERNRRILVKARKEHPEEPRFAYYFANEVYAEAATAKNEGKPALELLNAAIQAYEDYLPDAPSQDDAYLALHQIAECRRLAEDFEGAIKADTEALLVHPSWPDAYVGIAQSYMELGDWDRCEHWATAALNNCSEAETTQVREPMNNEYLPRLLRALSFEAYGRYEDALEELEIISQSGLANDEINSKITRIYEKREEDLEQEKQNVGPDSKEFKSYTAYDRRDMKSICFFHRPLFEPWHPDIVKEGGIGGAETCAIELSKRFAADGWRVVVYGTPGDHWGLDDNGVEWYDASEWRPTEEYDVFISSRTPEIFDHNIKAKCTILWMHDVNVGPNFEGPWGPRITSAQPDYVVGLTNWHVNHLQRIYDIPSHKMAVVPNGVDLQRFDNPTQAKQRNKFVWSSSPDRGLDVLIHMWPEIKESMPDAELHIFYGWEAINKILDAQPDHHLSIFKDAVDAAIVEVGGENAGIVWHGRKDQQTLANHLMTCDVWTYPSYFLETFCITALEMQAAGVIPLSTKIGGLQETVSPMLRNNLISGWPNNFDYKKRWLERLNGIQLMNDDNKHRARMIGMEYAARFTWDNAYGVWRKLLAPVADDKLVAVNPRGTMINV